MTATRKSATRKNTFGRLVGTLLVVGLMGAMALASEFGSDPLYNQIQTAVTQKLRKESVRGCEGKRGRRDRNPLGQVDSTRASWTPRSWRARPLTPGRAHLVSVAGVMCRRAT